MSASEERGLAAARVAIAHADVAETERALEVYGAMNSVRAHSARGTLQHDPETIVKIIDERDRARRRRDDAERAYRKAR